MKALTLILIYVSTSTLISCSKAKDSDKIGDAQFCMDTATAATVQTCVDKVAGIETAGAYIIRCSANFIENGFGSSQQIADTFGNLSTSGSSALGLLGTLNFGSTTAADTTFSNCTKTNQKGLTMLAAMVKSATAIASLGGLINADSPAEIQAAINALIATDPTAAALTIGTAVTTIYASSCQTGSPANADLCAQMDAAYASAGTTDPTAIGLALLHAWDADTP